MAAELDKDAVAKAYARWAPVYDLVFGAVFERGRKAAIAAAERIGGRILEVGVGTGLSLRDYSRTNRLTGVDLSAPMLRRAKARVAEHSLSNVEGLAVMDAQHLGFQDAVFDVVVAQYVITAVPDPEATLDEFARVVRPGGEIILVNHLGAESGPRASFERWFAPLARRLGWRPEFRWERLAQWAARHGGARVVERRAMPPLGHFSLIRFTRLDPRAGEPFLNTMPMADPLIDVLKGVAPLRGVRACVFDAYGTLFDFASAARQCRDVLGDDIDRLTPLWRDKQLQYTWLRAAQGRHADFWQVTGDALDFALETLNLNATGLRERLMALYLTLDAFPEVQDVLRKLKAAGLRTAILSNGSPKMLDAAVKVAKLDTLFDEVLSVEEVGVYKPDPKVYQLAVDRLGVPASAIAFQSSNAWDAYAASAFGMQVAWCNRYGQRRERLPGSPDREIKSLAELPALVGA